ncbi:hypothetical protein [Phyllobacterium leguminum]|uniref:Uncharacterized protein n=1 Tax=Phyllobacterium leguminum TaxID=314237 RepID=A0A318TE24_9HYPH|nr:hypothetical protein [Phyllobacterium leguminum]PYE89626.1 hypothetical protein C7477_103134 [Phyllobacterium leguminum]
MIDESLPPLPVQKDATNWRKAKLEGRKITLTVAEVDTLTSSISTMQQAFLQLFAAVTGAGGDGEDKRKAFAKESFASMHQSNAIMIEFLNSMIDRADKDELDGK